MARIIVRVGPVGVVAAAKSFRRDFVKTSETMSRFGWDGFIGRKAILWLPAGPKGSVHAGFHLRPQRAPRPAALFPGHDCPRGRDDGALLPGRPLGFAPSPPRRATAVRDEEMASVRPGDAV